MRSRASPWNWLLIVPFIGLLSVPIYNRIEPTLWSIPFFYWYQLAWVFITSGIILFVHAKQHEHARRYGGDL